MDSPLKDSDSLKQNGDLVLREIHQTIDDFHKAMYDLADDFKGTLSVLFRVFS
jgi:hypothetical protein